MPRIVGSKLALALALTGDQLSADEAKAMGLVYRVFDDEGFSDGVRAFAEGFAIGPAIAYRLIKYALREGVSNSLEEQLKREAELQGEAGRTYDFREAITAFAAKRPPKFEGSPSK